MRTTAQPAARRGSAKLNLKFLATLAVTGLLVAAGTGESHATTANVVKLQKHFAECLNWMFTDPAKHAKFCSPSRIPTSLDTMASSGGGTPPVVIVEPEPDPEECGPKDHGDKGRWEDKGGYGEREGNDSRKGPQSFGDDKKDGPKFDRNDEPKFQPKEEPKFEPKQDKKDEPKGRKDEPKQDKSPQGGFNQSNQGDGNNKRRP